MYFLTRWIYSIFLSILKHKNVIINMSKYLDHGRYELAISKVDHTQVHCGKWICGLSYYVLGYDNRESIAQEWYEDIREGVAFK